MVSPTARKQLENLRKDQKKKVVAALRNLAEDPIRTRVKADIKKLVGLKGQGDLYRLRVGGYRVIYEISEKKIWVSEIIKRSSAYKFLFEL